MFSRIGLTISFIAAFAAVSMAQGVPGFRPRAGSGAHATAPAGPGADRGINVLIKALDLTESQVASIKSLIQGERPQMQALLQDVKAKRQALQSAAGASTPDPATVGNALLALRASEANLKAARKQLMTSIENVLTPDQQKVVAALQTIRKGMMRQRGMGPFGIGGLLGGPAL